ncbi:extracellular solute-binding protein [Paenibacillus sp. J5C_2022]|uniref:extracellular solute-binding protein n=1 Tax=Paenibacillus sp. J5C2022 TaxID=2977129 RepID=UPI0021CFBDC8|nr:extracellular solute-binding protein [Paenibacillus sp. J5C2022]MCU6708758.1 extracellular solute-binding protein [Paenibacillus sp. J5C2022]
MKRFQKRLLTTSMLIVLCMIFVACSNEAPPSSSSSNTPQASPATSSPDVSEGSESALKLPEPVTVSLMTIAAEFNNDLPVYKNIFEATNIRIDGHYPAGDYAASLALTMAGGDIPDIIFINDNKLPKKYGSQGALVDFNEHLDQMPNLKAFWEERPDLKERATNYDGKTYQTIVDGLSYTNNLVWMYRKDIFEKHNIEVPATWDELHEVLRTLKELYPDSYPFTFRDKLGAIDNRMLPSFGIVNNVSNRLGTDELIFGQVQNEYRDMLGYLNQFYTEKLMNQDFLSTTVQQWSEVMTTDKAFITVDYIGRMQTLTDAMQTEGAQLTMMPPPAGTDGPAYVANMSYMPGGFTVFKNSPNLDAALHYVDFMYSDEGSEIVSWGKQGETWDIVDGQKKMIVGEDTLSLRQETGIGGFGSYGKFDSQATMTLLPKEYLPYYEEVLEYVYPEASVPSFNEIETERLAVLEDQLTKHRETAVSQFIIGDRPLTEWDQYVQEIERLGLPEVLNLYKTAFDRMKNF